MSGSILPEVRGSRIAAYIEKQRAVRIYGKQRAKTHMATTEQEDNMVQQTLPSKTKRHMTPCGTVSQRVRSIVLKALEEHGAPAVVSLLKECDPGRSDGAIGTAISKLRHRADEPHRDRWLHTWGVVARRIEAGKWATPKADSENRSTALSTGVDENLTNMIAMAVANAVDAKLEERLAGMGPKAADVDERLRHWEHLKQIIATASRDDRKFRARWSLVQSRFEVEHHDMQERARDLKIDTSADNWKRQLVVKEPVDFVLSLVAIARQEFVPQQSKESSKG